VAKSKGEKKGVYTLENQRKAESGTHGKVESLPQRKKYLKGGFGHREEIG